MPRTEFLLVQKKIEIAYLLDLVNNLIETNQLQIIDGLQIRNGYIEDSSLISFREIGDFSEYPFPLKMGLEERDEYASFKAHLPKMEEKLQDLHGRTLRHNEMAKNFFNDIRKHIESDPNLPPIKPDSRPIEEKVIPHTIGYMVQTLYSVALGYKPNYDFTKATAEIINDLWMIRVGDTCFAIVTKENIECFKSSLVQIQESKNLRSTALGINGSANQIIVEFDGLAKKLNHIISRGLISKDANYSFRPVRNCPICKELFTKIKEQI